ncbi:sigma-70 family RNA polymerase sigma factor [Proteocatella sphenisci]|uniref:sigma-70 family RNA polymerase sigma factor n=1 Tax=Proteocatella sphenisci TaxID=181070 RepID=UPI0004B7E2C2|nr:sigma-70 family RNA polymerase sigma factor [Proteocatella sphenisci]
MEKPRKQDRESASYKDDESVIRAQNGNKDEQELILKKYKNLVKKTASQYHIRGADREDLIQEGMIGLYKAIRDFNPEKKVYFHVFAQLCITRQIMTAVKTSNRQKHIPLNDYISLSSSADEKNEDLLENINLDFSKSPEEILIEKEKNENIRRTIKDKLTEKEARIVNLFILGFSYSEMADIVGISDKGISSTLQRAKKKLNSISYKD